MRPGLERLGWTGRWEALLAESSAPEAVAARVLRHDGRAVLAGFEAGVQHVHLTATSPAVTVGDWVVTDGERVTAVLARTSLLQRRDPSSGNEQLLAANVDAVLVVCGLDRPLKAGRIHRAVTQTWDAGATPIVVLTKADLVADGAAAIATVEDAAPAIDTLVVSAATGEGVDELAAATADRTVALLGESGAGKSTLVNALAGEDLAATGGVRTGDAKGRHTTTARQLHVLPSGGWLVDTPGLRELGLWTTAETVDEAFDDVAALAEDCRFADCRHETEPGCAVLGAVEHGTLPAARLEAWRSLRREAMSAELRADEHRRRSHEKQLARVVKEAQRHKRGR